MPAIETCVQKYFERGSRGARKYTLLDTRAALKTLKSLTGELKLTSEYKQSFSNNPMNRDKCTFFRF